MPPARCRTCGAHRLTGVCPVCQQFAPPPRSRVLGALLLGLIAAGLAVAGWVGLLWWRWPRWAGLFGHTGEPPELAEARSAALTAGLLLAAAVAAGVTATTRPPRTE